MADSTPEKAVPLLSIDILHGVFAGYAALDRSWPDLGTVLGDGTCGDRSRAALRIIDLRGREAFENRHLPGSSRLSPDEMGHRFLFPPHNRTLLLVGPEVPELRRAVGTFGSLGYTTYALDAPVSLWRGPWETGHERMPAWEPSPLALRWRERIPAGDAGGAGAILDLASGSCRDAVYLAMGGHRVVAIDHLPDALGQGRFLAERHGVSGAVRFVVADVERDPSSWEGEWSAIHVRRFLHRPALPLLARRLRPGGLLLYETFLNRQAQEGRRPRNPEYLLRSGELLAMAEGLEVLFYSEGQDDDGDWVARLVAARPQ